MNNKFIEILDKINLDVITLETVKASSYQHLRLPVFYGETIGFGEELETSYRLDYGVKYYHRGENLDIMSNTEHGGILIPLVHTSTHTRTGAKLLGFCYVSIPYGDSDENRVINVTIEKFKKTTKSFLEQVRISDLSTSFIEDQCNKILFY